MNVMDLACAGMLQAPIYKTVFPAADNSGAFRLLFQRMMEQIHYYLKDNPPVPSGECVLAEIHYLYPVLNKFKL
jgi:hypothetical protein